MNLKICICVLPPRSRYWQYILDTWFLSDCLTRLLKPIQQNVVVQMNCCVIWVMTIKGSLSQRHTGRTCTHQGIVAFLLPFANANLRSSASDHGDAKLPLLFHEVFVFCLFVVLFVCLFEACQTNLKVGHQWHQWAGCHRRADDVFQIVCHPSGAHHCGFIGTGNSDFKSDT